MFNITRTPVLILSSPRTGSSMIGHHIKTLLDNTRFFEEPDWFGQDAINEFHMFAKRSNNFIVKIHHVFLDRYGEELSSYLLQESYKIRLTRKDLVKQCASSYIANARNPKKFHYFKNEPATTDYIVPLDIQSITGCVRFLIKANKSLQDAAIEFDRDLVYEDLPEIANTNYVRTPRPANYDELLDVIRGIIMSEKDCSI